MQAEAEPDDRVGPVTVVERGSFSEARCACGWRGPARRSRQRARQDAAAHAHSGCPAHPADHPARHDAVD